MVQALQQIQSVMSIFHPTGYVIRLGKGASLSLSDLTKAVHGASSQECCDLL